MTDDYDFDMAEPLGEYFAAADNVGNLCLFDVQGYADDLPPNPAFGQEGPQQAVTVVVQVIAGDVIGPKSRASRLQQAGIIRGLAGSVGRKVLAYLEFDPGKKGGKRPYVIVPCSAEEASRVKGLLRAQRAPMKLEPITSDRGTKAPKGDVEDGEIPF